MILPETHAGELFESALPDLMQAVRNPEHHDAERLLQRTRQEISDSWQRAVVDERDAIEKAWHEAAAATQFDTLLAVAILLVERGVDLS